MHVLPLMGAQTLVECSDCRNTNNVTSFCKNCSAYYCNACTETHKSEIHQMISRTRTLRSYGSMKIAEQCKIHPDKEILSFCNDCKVPCCITCLAEDHQLHRFSTIENMYLDTERRINNYFRELDTYVIPKHEGLEQQLEAKMKEDNIREEKIKNDANEFREEFVKNFNKACDNFISEVQISSRETNKGLEEIEKSKKRVRSLKYQVLEKIQMGHLDIITFVPPTVESLIPILKDPKKGLASFFPSEKLLNALMEPVGKITYKEITDKTDVSDTTAILSHVQEYRSFESKIKVNSITTAGNNNAWVMSYGSPTMYLYNDIGEVVRSVTAQGSKGINDMAITKAGEIIVTCGDKKVRRVSLTGEAINLIDAEPFGCDGICLTEKEEIVICMNGQREKNHLAVYSPDGKAKLQEIRNDHYSKHLFPAPYRVVQNGQDLCVVNIGCTDLNVVCLDKKGNVRWIYNDEQSEQGTSICPRSICTDIYHNLLVTDFERDSVHYISKDGRLIQMILTYEQIGLQNMLGICMDNDTGHVWVGNFSKKVVIAKYLK